MVDWFKNTKLYKYVPKIDVIHWIEHNTTRFILIGVFIALIAPRLLTIRTDIEWLHFNDPVGDTFGGIMGPILNFLGIILLYLTLKSQNKSIENQNKALKNQRDFEIISKKIEATQEVFKQIKFNKDGNVSHNHECLGYAADYIDGINSSNEFKNKVSFTEFLVNYIILKNRLITLLSKNLKSSLTVGEKIHFFEECIFMISS